MATSTAVADRLEDQIDQVIPAGFSGQIAIGSAESVLFTKSFGLADREGETVVSNSMLFDIGSITKTFTATAILMLVERRSVTLDQTIDGFFTKLTPKTSAITIHQLLTHTSGLPLYSGDDDEPCNTACFDKTNFNLVNSSDMPSVARTSGTDMAGVSLTSLGEPSSTIRAATDFSLLMHGGSRIGI